MWKEYKFIVFKTQLTKSSRWPTASAEIVKYDGLSRFERARLSYRKHFYISTVWKNIYNEEKNTLIVHMQFILSASLCIHLPASLALYNVLKSYNNKKYSL